MSTSIPSNWQLVKVSKIAKLVGGGTPSRKNQSFFTGSIPWLTPSQLTPQKLSIVNKTKEYLTEYAVQKSSAKIIPKGSVLISSRASIGYVGIADVDLTTNQGFANAILNDEVNNKFFAYWAMSSKNRFENKARGTTFKEISKSALGDFEFPLAPFQEQQVIVDRIEELFSVVDNNVGSLKSTKKTLINLRRKILDHAFKGKLSTEFGDPDFNFDSTLQKLEDSRKKLFSTFKNSRYKQASSKVKKVNSKWLEIPLESFGLIETGATPLRGNSEYWKNGTIPWVTSTVVNQQKVTEASELITNKALKETNTKLFPIGTLLIAMYGEGKTRGKVSELMIEAATNQALAGVILSEEAEQYKEFIKLYLYKNYEDLRRLASGGVQPNLNLTMIKEMQIPFPSKKEQLAIVDILNRYLSIIDNSLAQIDQILAMTNGTKQSILKQAFEGKLV